MGVACAPGGFLSSTRALVGGLCSPGGGLHGPAAPTLASPLVCLLPVPQHSPTCARPVMSQVPRGREGPVLFQSLHFVED